MNSFLEHLFHEVRNKNVIITGATSGIGKSTAKILAENSANVILVERNSEKMQNALKEIKSSQGKTIGVLADISKKGGIDKVFAKADEEFDELHVLINNASLPFDSIIDVNYEDLEYAVKTNLLGYLACTAEAVKRMKTKAHIINIGSMSADIRGDSGSVYVATKAGIQAFSESIRKELNPKGIKVTLIEPGAVDTDMQQESSSVKNEKIKNHEMLLSEDVAMSVLFCLAQPERCDIVEIKIKPHRQFI